MALQVARQRTVQQRAKEDAAERPHAGRLPFHRRAVDFRFTRIHETGAREPPLDEAAGEDHSLPAPLPEPTPAEAAALAQE